MIEKRWVKVGVIAGLLFSSQLASLTAITDEGNFVVTAQAADVSTDGYDWNEATQTLTIKNDAGFNEWNAAKGSSEDPTSLLAKMKVVNIAAGITAIPYGAFADSRSGGGEAVPNLETVNFPETLTSIGAQAFYNCPKLTNITFPKNLQSIGFGSFYNCTSITSLVIPNSVTTIEDYAFMDMKGLNQLVFMGMTNPTTITTNAFRGVPENGTIVQPVESDHSNVLSVLPTGWKLAEYKPVVDVTGVPNSMVAGDTLNLNETSMIVPNHEGDNNTFSWRYQDKNLIDGKLQVNQPGEVTVTAIVTNKYGLVFTKDFTITVNEKIPNFIPVKSISISHTSMTAGERLNLEGIVDPADATNKEVTFELVDPEAGVRLNDHRLSADHATVVKVRAIVKNGQAPDSDFVQEFSVVVHPRTVAPEESHTVTFIAGEHGKLVGTTRFDVKMNGHLPGDKIPTPKADEGYVFSRWEDKDGNVVDDWNNVPITADTSYTAVFKKISNSDDDQNVKTIPLHRVYNPNTGEHFYTVHTGEKDNLVQHGWNYEGIVGNVAEEKGEPVYRLYNPNAGDHHYTRSASERDFLVGVGWKYEIVAFQSAGPVDVFRLYNPNAETGTHHYTQHADERDRLAGIGWVKEGIGWNAY